MKFSKKLFIGSTIMGLMSHGVLATAQGTDTVWQPRQLDEVLEEIVVSDDNTVSYTIKYGDTLSVISDAMNIELRYLAQINDILDVNLIHPETILTAQFDANQQAESMTVDSPDGEVIEVNIPVNLSQLPEFENVENSEDVIEVVEEIPAAIEETPALAAMVNEEVPSIDEMATESEFITEESTNELPTLEEPLDEALYSEYPTQVEDDSEAFVEAEPEVTEAPVVEPVVEEEVFAPEPQEETPLIPEEEVQTGEAASLDTSVIEDVPAWSEVEAEYTEEVPVVEEPIVEMPEETYEEVPVVEEPIVEIPEEIYEEVPAVEEEVVPEYVEPAYDPMTNPENAGLQPHAAAYKEEVASIYGVDSFNTYRAGDPQDHGQGLAVDFMVPVGSQVGDDIANYSVNNMAENSISYVIWEQQIYGDWNNQWEAMEDRGSTTANHYDHVHVSFYP